MSYTTTQRNLTEYTEMCDYINIHTYMYSSQLPLTTPHQHCVWARRHPMSVLTRCDVVCVARIIGPCPRHPPVGGRIRATPAWGTSQRSNISSQRLAMCDTQTYQYPI